MEKQTAQQGGTCGRKEESANYPWDWFCFCFSVFFPSPTLTSGLLKTTHASRGRLKEDPGDSVGDKPSMDREGQE